MDTLNETINTQGKRKFSFYEGFDGHYHKIGEIRDLIPQFKAFYYAQRRQDAQRSAIKIINDFNKQIAPFSFFPWEKQYRSWRKKWDTELLAEQGYKNQEREVRQLIKLRDEQNATIVPDEYALEAGAHTLGGELLNDAMDILKRDQSNESAYEDEIIIKRRSYALNVFNYVTRAAHGKQALNLKSNAEKRNTMDFIMVLLRTARAGKMTQEERALIRGAAISNKEII